MHPSCETPLGASNSRLLLSLLYRVGDGQLFESLSSIAANFCSLSNPLETIHYLTVALELQTVPIVLNRPYPGRGGRHPGQGSRATLSHAVQRMVPKVSKIPQCTSSGSEVGCSIRLGGIERHLVML
jgi:hypothetical protein